MDVFKVSWKSIANDENSISSRRAKKMPVRFDDEATFGVSNRQGLLHLLQRDEEDVAKERWHTKDQQAYETTVSYIGGIWIAMKGFEPSAETCRSLIPFPFIVQSRFIDLIKDQQPRALAVLAHYFALLASFRRVWWIGDTERREVQAFTAVLSSKWHYLMTSPLERHGARIRGDMAERARSSSGVARMISQLDPLLRLAS